MLGLQLLRLAKLGIGVGPNRPFGARVMLKLTCIRVDLFYVFYHHVPLIRAYTRH